MAMGSSMPEIFLNIIEIVFNKFETGALGPGKTKLVSFRGFSFDFTKENKS